MKKAFTMMELIMVMVVAGIIAMVSFPRLGENSLNEATDQLIGHIRYTQHLAMQDDRFDPNNAEWFKERWQLLFGTSRSTDNKIAYSIFSDRGAYSGNPDLGEIARNPLNQNQLLSGGFSGILRTDDRRATDTLNIGQKYGIQAIAFSNTCSASGRSRRIAFDNFGRPLGDDISNYTTSYSQGANGRVIQQRCVISLCTTTTCNRCVVDATNNVTCPVATRRQRTNIVIEAETGYVHML